MKKIIFAVCLLFATGAAYTQPSVVGQTGSDNHGQNLCECIGIGIPNPGQDQQGAVPVPGNQGPIQPKGTTPPLKELSLPMMGGNAWYAYVQVYLAELRNYYNQHNQR